MPEGMGELMEEIAKKTVVGAGYPVYKDTPYCQAHQKEHGNCKNCESVQNCRRLIAVLLLPLKMEALPDPQNLDEVEELGREIKRKMDEILSPEWNGQI